MIAPEFKSCGVIGHTGMVGGTVFNYLKDLGLEVKGFSLDEGDEGAFDCDLVFVAVPTPYRWEGEKAGYDNSIVEATLSRIKEGGVAVIKSTVQVGTTETMQELFPHLKVLFNPEFLSEATAEKDFRNPDRQIVGYTKQSYGHALSVLNLLPESAYDIILPAKEAELLKYINNLHGSLSVIEANHYYDICEAEGLDYERVIKTAEASRWVGAPMGRHYHKIFHKGKRGFAGKCFPKDVSAHLEYCRSNGIDCRLIEAAWEVNKDLLKGQGYTPEEAEKL